jgi:hypothetical protein
MRSLTEDSQSRSSLRRSWSTACSSLQFVAARRWDQKSHGTSCNEQHGTDASRAELKPILRARFAHCAQADNVAAEKSPLSSEIEWAGQDSNLRLED